MIEHIPCENQDSCPQADLTRGCFEDVHHLYYPRSAYKTGVQKQFRELDDNKVLMCRQLHNEEHKSFEVPEMPDIGVMWQAIHQTKQRRLG